KIRDVNTKGPKNSNNGLPLKASLSPLCVANIFSSSILKTFRAAVNIAKVNVSPVIEGVKKLATLNDLKSIKLNIVLPKNNIKLIRIHIIIKYLGNNAERAIQINFNGFE
ncbi:TPA: hypothetical protein H1046_002851, partial [Listeria monocytogenes]|nr:hypothetical protein [Listeria monocytogenes]